MSGGGGLTCGGLPHFAATATGHVDMWVVVARYVAVWAAFFYAVVGVLKLLERCGLALRPSAKAHENSVFFAAQCVACSTKSAIVSLMGLTAIWLHWNESAQNHFGGGDLAYTAGMIFGSFEVMDLCTCFLHNMLDAMLLVHHGVHISIGCIMMYNCGPHFSTAILLAQDLSGSFLNPYLLFRHRHPNHPALSALYAVFALFFVALRLGLGSWGSYYYLSHYREHLVEAEARLFPAWQAHLLAVALVIGSAMQFGFFHTVAHHAHKMLRPPQAGPKKDE
eukprot:Transcript_19260.p2 GENE.Transcript_19260~~Transcript_19260.p2  ORF type:complete len:297 (-),score=99.12 Transcript_19260:473-1309(-)